MELLVWLQETAIATWVRESVSLWAYPTQIALHAIGLALLVGLSTMVNLRLLGVARQIPLAALDRVFTAMWLAFALNLLSGTLLTIAYAEKLMSNPVFLIKLAGLVTAIVIVARMRGVVAAEAVTEGAQGVSSGARRLAVASLVSWTVTLVAGRLTAYEILLFGEM